MRLPLASLLLLPACLRAALTDLTDEEALYIPEFEQAILSLPCPDYTQYAQHIHKPFSDGPLKLPFQRPHPSCRKFTSEAVERVIDDIFPVLRDRDLAQIFRNAFPNTLDTTVLWHANISSHSSQPHHRNQWHGKHSFIVTGDINAEWLRDSTNQLSQYHPLATSSPELSALLLGAIATQTEFVIDSPYCNAFQPPPPSKLPPSQNGQHDFVHPIYEPSRVFECKYELDSLANFLSLGNRYHNATRSLEFLTPRWFMALKTVLDVLQEQSQGTFTKDTFHMNEYTFQRDTNTGTETLNLRGMGNPIAKSGLIRSAFRPSDDATIFPFLIPANALMSVELARTAEVLNTFAQTLHVDDRTNVETYATYCERWATSIRNGIMEHGIVEHKTFGKVLAYEVDGYGSALIMDDANVPSLLSLPILGFLEKNDQLYLRTRKMVLSAKGNPYYLTGDAFEGIGGPHIGLVNAWPMSVLVQAMTSDDEAEILECLERVKKISVFGLINESVNVRVGVDVESGMGMTRSWFAWANSVFAQCILWLAEEKPHLVFSGGKRYVVGEGFVENM